MFRYSLVPPHSLLAAAPVARRARLLDWLCRAALHAQVLVLTCITIIVSSSSSSSIIIMFICIIIINIISSSSSRSSSSSSKGYIETACDLTQLSSWSA